MKKIMTCVLILSNLLLASENNPKQIVNVNEKKFGIKNINNCDKLPKEKMIESSINKKSFLVGFGEIDKKNEEFYKDFKTGYQKTYTICKDGEFYILKIKEEIFKIEN